MPDQPLRERPGSARSKWWALSALSAALFMVMLDNTVVTVALPSIERDLGVGLQELEWIVNAYVLVFAALMLTSGRLADMLGRRRVFLAGLTLFTASSLACGLAIDEAMLIATRALQGVGAALMIPTTLSIVTATFDERERGLAIGIWAGVSSLALAIGPLVGGAIVQYVSWQWIFLLNLPIGIAGGLAGLAFIAESRDESAGRSLDLPGLVVSATAVFALVLGLIEANQRGWGSPVVLVLFAGGVVGLALFVALERRAPRPMLDLTLFRSAAFAGANVVALIVSVAMFGVLFFVSLYVQRILGHAPLAAGAMFLPLTVMSTVASPAAGKLADRIGARAPMTGGMALTGISLAMMSRLGSDAGFWDLAPGFVLAGLGIGLTMTPMMTAGMGAVPVAKAGVASGVLNTSRQLGGCLGIALMGAILAAHSSSAASHGASAANAFVDGLQLVLLVAAGLCFGGAAVAATAIRGAPHGAAEPVPETARG
jgi:EmrB/QacA subfamily drug resistance transporter